MAKRIIVVNAGPRKGWNTDTLIKEAAKGAEDAGATVEYFDLFKLEKYTGCISCFGCKKEKFKGHCICRDGLTPVLDAIREADGVIIGSPNYLGDVSAGMRCLMERVTFQNITYQTTAIATETGLPGLVYHTIGKNGATYRTFIDQDRIQLIDSLKPDLVIISLGTNDAFGATFDSEAMLANMDTLCTILQEHNPSAKILLTTPLETQKKHSAGHTIQSGIAAVRDIIVNYGKTHNVAVWDFYNVGGGAGASAKWLDAGYMQSDRLHLKEKGYHLQGELLAKALLKLFQAQ